MLLDSLFSSGLPWSAELWRVIANVLAIVIVPLLSLSYIAMRICEKDQGNSETVLEWLEQLNDEGAFDTLLELKQLFDKYDFENICTKLSNLQDINELKHDIADIKDKIDRLYNQLNN